MKKSKRFMKWFVMGAMLAAPLFCSTLVAADPSSPTGYDVASRPSIIVILADDMGYSDIGCYGGDVQTPNLDRMAANGMHFTHMHDAPHGYLNFAPFQKGAIDHAEASFKRVFGGEAWRVFGR